MSPGRRIIWSICSGGVLSLCGTPVTNEMIRGDENIRPVCPSAMYRINVHLCLCFLLFLSAIGSICPIAWVVFSLLLLGYIMYAKFLSSLE